MASQTFSLYIKSRGETVTFSSDLSDDAVVETLRKMRSQFAQDLACKYDYLSPTQYAWAHKLATDEIGKAANPANSGAESAEYVKLFDAFQAAVSRGAKRMKMRFDGISVSPNRDLTALWVTSLTETEQGEYGPKPKYLGKVTRSGLDSRLPDTVKEVLIAAAADPLTAAIRYGKDTGECSCCGRELTNSESIRLGIGPICREKFGL